MTKNIFFIVLFAFTAIGAQAQTKSDNVFKTFRFGLYTGPTFNSLKAVASESENYMVTRTGNNVGFSLGICADYNLNDRYAVFSGVSLDWRGGSMSAIHDTTAIKSNYVRSSFVKYKLQYLTIPIGLKMKAAQVGNLKIFAQTGIDLAFLLSQKGDYTVTPIAGQSITKTKQKLGGIATTVPVNIGWMLGAGAEYEINDKNSVFFTILYRNGFSDVTTPQNNDDGFKFSDGNIRSNTIALRVGYYF